jgi:succinate dehydrogenase hydrophobic anchor subunit
MKSNPVYTPFTALALKLVGVIMIVSSLLDYISLAIPPKLESGDPFREWQWVTTTQVVNQGIVPLVGIALVVVGYWIASSIAPASREKKSPLTGLRFWAFGLSSLLGLIFLVLVLLHTSNTLWRSSENFKKIEAQATQLESQLETQSQEIDTVIKQLKDPEKRTQAEQELKQLEEAIEKEQIPANQLPQAQAQVQIVKNLLEASKQNPDAAPEQFKEANLNKIRSQKKEAENQVKSQVWKPGIKTIINSLLLAIGYIAIGWMGLRSLGS